MKKLITVAMALTALIGDSGWMIIDGKVEYKVGAKLKRLNLRCL